MRTVEHVATPGDALRPIFFFFFIIFFSIIVFFIWLEGQTLLQVQVDRLQAEKANA